MKGFWGEFRTGSPLASGLITIVTGLFIVAQFTPGNLLPGCADPLNVALIVAVTVSPVALGAAAVHVANLSSSGLLRVAGTSVRGRGGALRRAWLVCASWQWLGVIAIHAAVYANSDTSGFCSMAMLVLPSLAFVFATLMSAIGVLVGSFFPHWAAGVITTIASFIVVLGAQQLEGDLGRLVPTSIFTFYQPFFEPNVQLHLGRVAFFVTLSTMIWFALARDSWRSLAGTAVAAFALVASIGLTWSADSSPVQYRTPAESVCLEENGVEFCTWPESSDALQAGLNAVTSTLAVVGGRFPTPESFVQEGLRPIGEAGVMRFDSRAITDSDLTFAAVRALVPEPGCDIGLSAWFDLIDWVTFQMSPEFATPELESLKARGDRAERQWLMERYALATDACA